MTVSNAGVLIITFSEVFIIPSQFSMINSSALNVEIIPSGAVEKKYLGFTWNVTDFTSKSMTI